MKNVSSTHEAGVVGSGWSIGVDPSPDAEDSPNLRFGAEETAATVDPFEAVPTAPVEPAEVTTTEFVYDTLFFL